MNPDADVDSCLPPASGDVDVSVTLVSTNERHYLEPMLPQLYRSAEGVRMEVLLVDNASEDGTSDFEGSLPGLYIIRNEKRLGFSANHNLAMKRSRGRYLLCLNPDVLFDEQEPTVGRMVAFMDAHTGCGVAGCRGYDGSGEFQYPARRFQTLRIVLARRAGRLFGFEKVLDTYYYKEHSMHATYEADWLLGCFLFVRRKAVMEVGLFDPLYVKYFEDVDLCRRMACHGWSVMYYGGTHYYHVHQRGSKRLLSRDARLHLRSWLRWYLRRGYYRRLEREHAPRSPGL